MLRNAQSMVLHARAPANVAQDEDLDVFIGRVLRRATAAGNPGVERAANPDKRLGAIGDEEDEDGASGDGQEEGEQHCGRMRHTQAAVSCCILVELTSRKVVARGKVAGLRGEKHTSWSCPRLEEEEEEGELGEGRSLLAAGCVRRRTTTRTLRSNHERHSESTQTRTGRTKKNEERETHTEGEEEAKW